jgi:DNA polymerase III delta prime subunit
MSEAQELIGHNRLLIYLKNCAQNRTLSHAYALIGPNSTARENLLEEFLKEFVPMNKEEHPDVLQILPEKEVITIDTVRKARSWLSMTPISSTKKVLIVDGVGKMNTQAQNAFLKILEEPSKNSYIFLLIGHKDQVLQTIYSRIVPLYCISKKIDADDTEDSLMQELIEISNVNERMRLWMQANIEKSEIRSWIEQSVPALRNHVISTKTKNSAIVLRSILHALANPSSRNWQMEAEHLIISL